MREAISVLLMALPVIELCLVISNAVPASPSQIATMHLQRIDQTFGLLATKEDARSCWAIC
ncbi:hypothetical protein ASV14_03435 [Enterobacter cloacae subsp. cloacae]|nr:hypothetical protein ASV14_03435 [Enterobacter cloacae subsp. cloacae]RTO10667.1 hypothetical protein EKN72_15290 [Enterobacter cloacae]KTI68165.1 hypothetical protein ASV00_16100 [Enterobacter cloacae subsp. cloacae]KVI55632.1 hypothetical protein AWS52_15160 [Enterobacter cloacae subsp. cloacae]RTO63119.1 hypothetical protein EKN66_15945 [Enterobacter cloacae]